MKNILIIPPFYPYPLSSGGHQAIYNGIAILKDVANVYVLAETTESQYKRGQCDTLKQALPFVHIVPYIDPSSRHTFSWYCKVLFNKIREKFYFTPKVNHGEDSENKSRKLLQDTYDFPQDETNFILEVIHKYKIDIVQVEMIPKMSIVKSLPDDVRKIFVHHELKFVRDELVLNQLDDVTDEHWRHWKKNKEEEVALLNQYDDIITLSAIDTAKLQEAGVKKPITTSLAVISDAVKPLYIEKPISKVLSYVGPEEHYPNYDGVMWFLQNCWEKLRTQDPEYSFQIIGKWSDLTAENLANNYENVHCLGFVDNLGDAISGTTMIVPLNIGSGIRMKILEAARFGVPVVATPVGAEGLPLVDGEHAFIAAAADDFIKDIIALQEESLRRKFVENTRKAIENQYSFEALKRNRVALYE